MEECTPTGDKTVLLINALLHSAVLFTFLSVFYMVYGSKIETKATNEKFAGLISSNLKKILEKGNEETGGELQRGMAFLIPAWNVLERDYQGEDPTVKTYNTWLFRTASMVAGFLVGALFLVLVVLKFACGHCPSSFLWNIVRENVVIFALVGGVEYLFFKNVALKMIPAPPSLMVDQVVSKIKDGIF